MDWTQFEKRLTDRMEKEHIPGVAIAVMQHGETVYEKGFGVRDFASKKPVTPETIFGTASVTKSLTGLAIMKLAEAGELSVADAVVTYLPSFQIQGIEPITEVKIHHLLTHSTGLAPIERHEEHQQFVEHLTYLKEKPPEVLGRPGEYFSYSNDAFLLLGAIIEKVTGRLYRRFLMEEIVYPLGMNRSTFSIEELEKMCNVSVPYVYNKDTGKHEAQAWPTLGVYEVGGGLRSSVRDLMKYGALFLNEGKVNHKIMISKSFLEKMYQPYMKIDTILSYGYGFKVTPHYYGTILVEHSGGQPGVASNFGFLPEKDISIAVLTNVSGAIARDIWLEAVHIMLGLSIDTKSSTPPVKPGSKTRINYFVGEFSSEEGDVLKITKQADNLLAHYNGETFQLDTRDRDVLVMKETEKSIRFFFHKDGTAWAVFVGMRMLMRRN